MWWSWLISWTIPLVGGLSSHHAPNYLLLCPCPSKRPPWCLNVSILLEVKKCNNSLFIQRECSLDIILLQIRSQPYCTWTNVKNKLPLAQSSNRTYNIAIRGPAYNIPFDCDVAIRIKWIICIWKSTGRKEQWTSSVCRTWREFSDKN